MLTPKVTEISRGSAHRRPLGDVRTVRRGTAGAHRILQGAHPPGARLRAA
jgi:hypothetical protein